MASKLEFYPAGQAIVLRNETCAYCGTALTRETRTKEHVIGRRFVPRGSLHQHWNLIAWACEPCNRRKAELEDDLSAISMHPDVTGAYVRDDPRLHAEAARKGRSSISRRSGKPVGNSREKIIIEAPFLGGATIKFQLEGGPQADEARIIELVRMQLVAFFYFITTQPNETNGRFWRGGYMPLSPVRRPDWGNGQMRWFMAETRSWDWAFYGATADGYFRIAVRRHPDPNIAAWAFGVEWNANYRTVGFFGDRDELLRLRDLIPALQSETLYLQGNDRVEYRRGVPLKEDDDTLFEPPSDDQLQACPDA